MRNQIIFIAMLLLCAPAGAQRVAPAEAFGARESVVGASLSPDGLRMAFIAPAKGQGNALFTVPVDGSAAPRLTLRASGDPERLNGCNWVSNERLVCRVYALRSGAGELVGISRMIAVNIDGTDVKVISRREGQNALYLSRFGGTIVDWLPGQQAAVLMGRDYVPEGKIGSLIEQRREGFGVDRVDTVTLQAKRIVNPVRDAVEFISDGLGHVRIMGVAETKLDGYTTGVIHYRYRAKGSEDWRELGDYNSATREGFNPYAVDSEADVAYGFRPLDGRLALYTRRLDGSGFEELVYSRPDVDIDGLIRLGRKGRVVGLTFATERRQAIYFDPALAKLRDALKKALPGVSIINFEGASDDEQQLLLWAGSDVDPGRYYILDRATKQLRPIILSRPELAGYTLAPVKSVMVRASDGTSIPAYLTLPPGSTGSGLSAIVMPHGGPNSRDEWGFDWLAQFYANRGFAVLQPNFRGSSGYGDGWFQNNGFQSWRIAIGDVVDSGRWLISQGIADPAKLAIVGWSYGGYAALQSGVVAPGLFKAIVAIAPVTDLNMFKAQYRGYVNYIEARDFIGSGPHIRDGSPAQNAAAITAPVMLFHGELDQNVEIEESALMADQLGDAGKPAQFIRYPGLDHRLDDSAARADMLARSDAFLRKSLRLQ